MTQKQKILRNALLAKVHTSKRWRSYYKEDREAYEAMLKGAFGVDSAAKLTIDQLKVLVDWLNERSDALPRFGKEKITPAQLSKLTALWHRYANDKSDSALLRFVLKVSGKSAVSLELIDKDAATKAIVALTRTLKER